MLRDGVVYLGSGSRRPGSRGKTFYAVDVATGKLCWKYALGSPFTARAWVTDDMVYVDAHSGDVYAFE